MNTPTERESDLLAQLLDQQTRQTTATVAPAPVQPKAAPAPPPAATTLPTTARSIPVQVVTREPQPIPAPAPAVVVEERPTRSVTIPRDLETGIFKEELVEGAAKTALRGLAFVGLGVSFFGSVLTFNGGWEPSWSFWQGISPIAWVLGILTQAWVTLLQWGFRRNPKNPIYLFHVGVDAFLSYRGYWPVLGVLLVGLINKMIGEQAFTTLIAGGIFAVACVALAIFPEQVLIKRRRHQEQ